jgi:S-adenosylmethionine:tRNA ribosyltransferase-isomerase
VVKSSKNTFPESATKKIIRLTLYKNSLFFGRTAMQDNPVTFDYEVPRRLVAQQPLSHRTDARLMVVDRRRQQIEHSHIRDLPHLLAEGDRLVLNDTRVIPAQLAGRRSQTGGRWQGLFIETTPHGDWRILCKTRGRLKPGEAIALVDREGRPAVKLWLLERQEEGQWLAHPESEDATATLLERVGRVPLPPYIRGGNMVDADVGNYQTVFAERPGAIAAPTAGLHFTNGLLKGLEARGVPNSKVTLHVGLGTFRPIETEDVEEHRMHTEWGEVSAATAAELNATRAAGGRIINGRSGRRQREGDEERGRGGEAECISLPLSLSPILPVSCHYRLAGND